MTKDLHTRGIVVFNNPFEEFVPSQAKGLTADVAGVVNVVDGKEHVAFLVFHVQFVTEVEWKPPPVLAAFAA
jgi:hypothetical protein